MTKKIFLLLTFMNIACGAASNALFVNTNNVVSAQTNFEPSIFAKLILDGAPVGAPHDPIATTAAMPRPPSPDLDKDASAVTPAQRINDQLKCLFNTLKKDLNKYQNKYFDANAMIPYTRILERNDENALISHISNLHTLARTLEECLNHFSKKYDQLLPEIEKDPTPTNLEQFSQLERNLFGALKDLDSEKTEIEHEEKGLKEIFRNYYHLNRTNPRLWEECKAYEKATLRNYRS